MSFKEEFQKGEESAKIRSRKQGNITAILVGLVLGISIFNGFPILVKVLIFVVLMLILGAVMSSNLVQRKLRPQTIEQNERDMLHNLEMVAQKHQQKKQ